MISTGNRLTIVIPALNEEAAIASTIERCLEVRDLICRAARLDGIEIVVVSDGSTDRTVEIAQSYEDVRLIVFEKNRGYGAAIKAGFAATTTSLVGFLDADGTCNPEVFATLCRRLLESRAEISLGSRLGPDSKMPTIRRIGNRMYAFLLGLICGEMVTDTASGMRVINRSALEELYPLPDGLHFTPAMSARALLSGMKIVEFPMSYQDRVGQSKLSVVRDGVRFLKSIIDGVLCYRPERLFLFAFGACLLLGLIVAAYPVEFYLREARLEEWMIYRFIVCSLLGSSGFILLAAGTIAHRFVLTTNDSRVGPRFWPSSLESLFCGKTVVVFIAAMIAGSLILVAPGLLEYMATRHLTLHWSRVMVAAFGILIAFQAMVTATLLQVFKIRQREERLSELAADDRKFKALAIETATTASK